MNRKPHYFLRNGQWWATFYRPRLRKGHLVGMPVGNFHRGMPPGPPR